jgi:hypothetical protein
MNQSSANPTQTPVDDGLDRLLREYFQRQLPRQFPPLPIDAENVAPAALIHQPSSMMSRSRWVLATCVALVLLGLGLLLSHSNGRISTTQDIAVDPVAKGTNPMPSKNPGNPQK